MNRINLLFAQKKSIDWWLVISAAILVVFGLIAIYDASGVLAYRDFGDKFYYFKNQLMWVSFGFIALLFFSFYDYHKLLKLSYLVFILSIVALVLVLIPQIGTKIYGARRWINIGSFTFQPSEFAKLALIFYEVAIISKFEKFKIKLSDAILVVFLPAMIITGLVIIQPDLGTALIFTGLVASVYFAGNAPLWHFLISIPFVVLVAILAILVEPYRFARLKSFLDPSFDPQGASYQINQILIALGGGGLLGVGLGASRGKFAFIPEVQTDAIFAIIVEELGFLGGLFLIAVIMLFISRAIKIAREAGDTSGKLLALGIASLFSIQSLFNLASVVALVPLTGIPLPFISYGGSSLFVSMVSVGILINISRQKKETGISNRS